MIEINENELARIVTLQEGGAINLSIAQVKEVIRLVLKELAKRKASEVMALIEKHQEDGR